MGCPESGTRKGVSLSGCVREVRVSRVGWVAKGREEDRYRSVEGTSEWIDGQMG